MAKGMFFAKLIADSRGEPKLFCALLGHTMTDEKNGVKARYVNLLGV